MSGKRGLVCLISVAFIAVAVFVFFYAFTIKSVDVDFTAVNGSSNYEKVQEELDTIKGSNLLTLNTEEIKQKVEKDPYFEVVSIQKKYPNVLSVEIKERVETYVVQFEDELYCLSEEGIVLKKVQDANYSNCIKLSFESGISISNVEIGKKLQTTENQRFNLATTLVKEVNLTDCIKEMIISKSDAGVEIGVYQTNIDFLLCTQGRISIRNVESQGKEKANACIKAFNEETSDYIKSINMIESGDLIDGTFYVVWKAL